MESIQDKIDEHKRNIERKTCTVKELAKMLDISEAKARQITRMEGFPVIKFGERNVRIIISKIDEFLEEHIGSKLL